MFHSHGPLEFPRQYCQLPVLCFQFLFHTLEDFLPLTHAEEILSAFEEDYGFCQLIEGFLGEATGRVSER